MATQTLRNRKGQIVKQVLLPLPIKIEVQHRASDAQVSISEMLAQLLCKALGKPELLDAGIGAGALEDED